jgi:type II secretory pathway component PulF
MIDLHRAWARLSLRSEDRLGLYRKISTMLSNGLPLLRVLDDLYLRASERGRKPTEPLALMLFDWKRSVQSGRLLSDGMQDWVPKPEQLIVMAGEQAGSLEAALSAVIGVVHATRKVRGAIIGGVAYPALIGVLILVYVYLFGTRVIPEFGRISNPETWHGAARSLYLMSLVMQQWMLYAVAAFMSAVAAVLISLPRWRGGGRVMLDRLPPYSIYRLVSGTGFLLAFSALLSAGVTVEKSLLRLCQPAPPWLRERLEGALLGVKSGLNCGEALKNAGYGFPSREIVDDLCIYADYRGFPEALKLLADEWMEQGVEKITADMKLLNSASIVALALVIAWLAVGLFGIQQEVAALTRLGK